ncbi:hypothetical protein GOODEAATRI_030751 [Goodea atripinnis]|uniref:Uncharacterized protein n=1 Tax=Goodea atripinnis TaxID=208336 RepID=A0ABV0NG02_9TELE
MEAVKFLHSSCTRALSVDQPQKEKLCSRNGVLPPDLPLTWSFLNLGNPAVPLTDDKLCMPLLLGLDFMNVSQILLKPHLGSYVLPGGKEYRFKKWPSVWTKSFGATSVINHRIVTVDELPFRRRAYRVSQ